MRRVAALAIAAVAAAACSGPSTDADLAVREVRADVLYGGGRAVVVPAPPTVPAPPRPTGPLPAIDRPPLPTADTAPPNTPTTVDPGPCPTADPLALPDSVVSPELIGSVAPGTYRYVVDGREQQRIVGPTVDGRYDVTVVDGDARTTTTWQVTPTGLAIVKVQEGRRTFAPLTPVVAVPLPAAVGSEFTSTGVDVLSLTVLALRGRVVGTERIDVCGEPVDGMVVQIGEGPLLPPLGALALPIPLLPPLSIDPFLPRATSRLDSLTEHVAISGRIIVAPQLGGLVLVDGLSLHGDPAEARLLTVDPEPSA